MSVGFLRLASTIHYRNGNGHVLFDRHNDGKIQILPKCKKKKKKSVPLQALYVGWKALNK